MEKINPLKKKKERSYLIYELRESGYMIRKAKCKIGNKYEKVKWV